MPQRQGPRSEWGILVAASFTEAELERYARSLVLPGWGTEAQQKLAGANVLLIGAGGLGSPCAFQLAAVGIGRLTIVEGDAVELSNLQRQTIHSTDDLGRPKVESAAEKLRALRPDIDLVLVEDRLSPSNALDLFSSADVVVDASDNYETRFLANDAAVLTATPLAHGSVFRYEGQATTIVPGKGPCLRCIYPEPPAPGAVPGGAEAGVFGVVPGVIGTLQAGEAIKLITGLGELLVGRLIVYDALSATFEELAVSRDSACAVCGDRPTITSLC
jgi:molybdopterin/thiamine biosynthesis adenylyltransferase